MKNKAPRKKPAVNRVYYIYVGILAVLFFTFHTIPFLKGVIQFYRLERIWRVEFCRTSKLYPYVF